MGDENKWTVIYQDDNGNLQYSYVEGEEFEEIPYSEIAKGTQFANEEDWEDLEACLADETIVCWIPGHVAVNFP